MKYFSLVKGTLSCISLESNGMPLISVRQNEQPCSMVLSKTLPPTALAVSLLWLKVAALMGHDDDAGHSVLRALPSHYQQPQGSLG